MGGALTESFLHRRQAALQCVTGVGGMAAAEYCDCDGDDDDDCFPQVCMVPEA